MPFPTFSQVIKFISQRDAPFVNFFLFDGDRCEGSVYTLPLPAKDRPPVVTSSSPSPAVPSCSPRSSSSKEAQENNNGADEELVLLSDSDEEEVEADKGKGTDQGMDGEEGQEIRPREERKKEAEDEVEEIDLT